MSTTNAPPPKVETQVNPAGHVEFLGLRLYSLWFRRGNRKPETLVFHYKGDLPSAIKRAQAHCTVMDYRFCGTYPFVVDLDLREKYRNENLNTQEEF